MGGTQSGREHIHSELQHYEMMNLRGNAAQLGSHNQTGANSVISQNATPNIQRQIPTLEGHASALRPARQGRNASNQLMPSLISAHSAAKLQHNDYSDSHANQQIQYGGQHGHSGSTGLGIVGSNSQHTLNHDQLQRLGSQIQLQSMDNVAAPGSLQQQMNYQQKRLQKQKKMAQ